MDLDGYILFYAATTRPAVGAVLFWFLEVKELNIFNLAAVLQDRLVFSVCEQTVLMNVPSADF